VIHATLTGISMALMNFLGVRLGFTFSAGAFDYIISYRLGTNGWMLIPVGLVYFLIYYFLFSFAIRKFNLATPGRAEAALELSAEGVQVTGGAAEAAGAPAALAGAVGFVRALGGNRNLKLVDACTTRLRLEVVDDSLVNEPALRTLGARGIVRPSRNVLQVVIGPQAEIVAGEIRERRWPVENTLLLGHRLKSRRSAQSTLLDRSLSGRLRRVLKTQRSLSTS
jgi:N-acetylglucosamine PTS system EIICBA or EIICB component